MKVGVANPKNRLLISGTNSGLGKFLHENLGGEYWNRDITQKQKEKFFKKGVDIIIHCAFNSSKNTEAGSIDEYISDNVLLTAQLLKVPHKKFIFVSSVEVYPKNGKVHKEDEGINLGEVYELYGMTKLFSENLVKKLSQNHLILRCSSLLGKDSRKGNLVKLLEDRNPVLALRGDSQWNLVLHSDVLEFIKIALRRDLKGIYNVTSSKNIKVSEAAKLLGKKVKFGNFKYMVGRVNNKKIISQFPEFDHTSELILKKLLNILNC